MAGSKLADNKTATPSLVKPRLATGTVKSKRKKKNKKKALYDQYLADSESERSSILRDSGENASNAYEFEDFEPGMDINILIQQTIQNVVQSVSLEDYDGQALFGDSDLICFGAAVRHNSSILSLQIRYLDVSDASLVPLCCALEEHPCIRALDLSGTRGGKATIDAVFRLVCTNPNILFVRLDDTMANLDDNRKIQLATRYNALACPDPTNNPFHLGLLRRIGDMEEEEQRYKKQLSAHSWLFANQTDNASSETKKPKKDGFAARVAKGRIGADICALFMCGQCSYGSRCRYIHPDKTTALQNAIAISRYKVSADVNGDATFAKKSSFFIRPSAKVRLQSRLRPVQLSLKTNLHFLKATGVDKIDSDSDVADAPNVDAAWRRGVWMFSASVLVCCMVLTIAY